MSRKGSWWWIGSSRVYGIECGDVGLWLKSSLWVEDTGGRKEKSIRGRVGDEIGWSFVLTLHAVVLWLYNYTARSTSLQNHNPRFSTQCILSVVMIFEGELERSRWIVEVFMTVKMLDTVIEHFQEQLYLPKRDEPSLGWLYPIMICYLHCSLWQAPVRRLMISFLIVFVV